MRPLRRSRLEAEFKRYLHKVLFDVLYLAAKEEYERHVAPEPEGPKSDSQEKQFLKALEPVAIRYASKAVIILESRGLNTHGDLLSNEAQIRETMGDLQRKMFDELSVGR